jgi:hypothetical protein
MINTSDEYEVWRYVDPEDLWVFDKLILARRLGYTCGPTGIPVPNPGVYIVRPCVNAMGLGLGTKRVFIDNNTEHLPVGHFWIEEFDGPHLSVDYHWGEQVLCVQGFKPHEEFIRWAAWSKVDFSKELPDIIKPFAKKYEWINCEFIGNKVLEIHFRRNPDFDYNNSIFIPVWNEEMKDNPRYNTMQFIECPDVNGRIGAFVK